tara:strand:- start:1435 stop:2280 length:846 start_codon:yes stop_codon:yes gene_type:complete
MHFNDKTCRVFSFKISPRLKGADILTAELSELGFYAFEQSKKGIEAYIYEEKWKQSLFSDISLFSNPEFKISYKSKLIRPTNWNQNWEKNFKPVKINECCGVRAKFHESLNLKYEIIITPKMSFGTGHHETTAMMLSYLLEVDLKDSTVLDVGSGTGILAILSEKRGAKLVDAIDIDIKCIKNIQENSKLNNCKFINPYFKNVSKINGIKYDLIIANINKNVIIDDILKFSNLLSVEGQLIISGFFLKDFDDINNKASSVNLHVISKKEKNKWLSVHYIKK